MGGMNLEQFCLRFHALLEQRPALPRLIEEGQPLFGELVSDPGWFQNFLKKLILDRDFLNTQEEAIYPNEFTLYRSPDRSFSVLGYFWEPHTSSSIHDHGSWGIVGALFHRVRETKYRRIDDGKVEGHAELEKTSSEVIEPGGLAHVLPLNAGIHEMEAVTGEGSMTVSVYGRSIRKGYIQFFDPGPQKVRRIYPPKLLKKMLAIRALGSISESWAEELLTAPIPQPVPDYLQKEYQKALSRLQRIRSNLPSE